MNPYLENSPHDEKWLPMSEAAKLTPYSAEYLSLLARKKKLTSKKIGNVWYTTKPILEAYMNKQMLRVDIQNGNLPSVVQSQSGVSTSQVDKVEHVDAALRPQIDLDKQEANLSKVRSMQSDLRKHEEKQVALGQTETVGENRDSTMRGGSEIKREIKETHYLGEIEEALQKVIYKNFISPESKIKLIPKTPVVKAHFKRAFGTKVLMAATLISILSLTILPVPFAFSLFEKTYESAKSAWNDANTVMGFRPGVGKNQILLLDDTGSISIMGHIATEGQFISGAPEGVAPIVVDSKTEIKNLNAEYLNNMHSADFTLAFVTANGSVTTEDVKLDGQVEVGQTLLVHGATKLLSALRVDGDLRVFGAAEFDKTLKVVGPALFEGVLQAKGDITAGGDLSVEKDVTAGGNLSVRKNANIRGALEVGSAVLAKSGSFGSLGVSDGLSAKGKINLGSAKENLIIDAKNLSVDKNGNAAFDGSLTLGGDLTSSGSVTFPSLTVTNSTTTNATTTNLFAASGTFGDILVTGDSRVNGNFTVGGDTTTIGQLLSTRIPTLAHVFAPAWPLGTSNASDATIYINPASAGADTNIFAAAVNGAVKFLVDAEGDVYANNLVLAGSTSQGATTIAGNLTVQDNATFGDASTDITTVNSQLNVLASTTLANLNFLNATGTSLFVSDLSATNSNLTNSTTTNFYSSSLIASNSTSTNFFANKLSSLLATITSLVADDISVGALTATSSTATNSTTTNSTTTNAFVSSLIASNSTSTNSYSTTASSTNLFSTLGNIGTLTSGLINGQTISSAANFTGSLAVAGAVTGSTYNGLTISGSGGTLTIPTLSSLIRSGAHALTLTTTASTNVTLPTSGILYGTLANSITSADLLASVSNETGSGSLVFGTSPALTTPNIGAATGSSLNLSSGAITSGLINGQTISSAANFTGSLAVSGAVTGASFSGSGASLTSLNASNLSSGTVASARIAGSYTGITSVGTLSSLTTSGSITLGGPIIRSAVGTGYLNGNYSSVENGATSGAIYSIGGPYVPGTTTLGNMYGIGYTLGNAAGGVGADEGGQWGMYVASAGVANVFLGGTTGNIRGTGTITGSLFSGSGASLTSLNASNLSSGTLASARIAGSYTGITSVGTLSSLTAGGTVHSTSGGFVFPDGSTQTSAAVENPTPSGEYGYVSADYVDVASYPGSYKTLHMNATLWGSGYLNTSNNRFTVPTGKGGIYTVGWGVDPGGGPAESGGFVLRILKNGTTVVYTQSDSATVTLSLAAGDYIEFQKFFSDQNITIVGGSNRTYAWMVKESGGLAVASDRRLKTDIKDFEDGLDKVMKINPVWFTYTGQAGTEIGHENIGVIAQDVKDIIPYAVGTFKGDLNGQDTELFDFNQQSLDFLLVNSVKELNTRSSKFASSTDILISDLTFRVDDLTSSASSTMMTLASTTEAFGLNLADASAGLDISRDVIIRGALKVDHIGAIGDILSLESDVEFIGRPYFNSDTGGIAIIQKDSRQVDVVFDKEYSDAPVISASVTLNASTTASQSDNILSNGVHYVVTNRSGSGFSILLSGPAPEDMQFSWIALAIKNLRISSSSNATQPGVGADQTGTNTMNTNTTDQTNQTNGTNMDTATSTPPVDSTGSTSLTTSSTPAVTSSSTPVTTTAADTNATSTPPVDASSTPPTSTESGVGAPTESVGADSTTTTSTSTPTSTTDSTSPADGGASSPQATETTTTPTDTSSSTPAAI